MRSLTHISFYPPPSMPPVQPATAWYCPRILTTAWAMWPGGAVMEYRPVPFLPNGELGLKMATDVSMSLVEGASISSAFEKEYGDARASVCSTCVLVRSSLRWREHLSWLRGRALGEPSVWSSISNFPSQRPTGSAA